MNHLKSKILDYIKKENYAVISTINRADQPESALVAFSSTKDLELMFASNINTRKAENIRLNPNISVVIGFPNDDISSVQLEGVARVVDIKDAGEYADIHFERQPVSLKHKDLPGECLVIITLTWARYTKYSKPEEIIEEYFDAD